MNRNFAKSLPKRFAFFSNADPIVHSYFIEESAEYTWSVKKSVKKLRYTVEIYLYYSRLIAIFANK